MLTRPEVISERKTMSTLDLLYMLRGVALLIGMLTLADMRHLSWLLLVLKKLT